MNADDLRAYKQRWQLVAEAEQRELAQTTAAQKFADLGMLMQLARSCVDPTSVDEEDEQVAEVRRRWALLADRMGA